MLWPLEVKGTVSQHPSAPYLRGQQGLPAAQPPHSSGKRRDQRKTDSPTAGKRKGTASFQALKLVHLLVTRGDSIRDFSIQEGDG